MSTNNQVQALLDLDHDTFRKVVEAEVKGEVPKAICDALRTAELVDRWNAVLGSMIMDVDTQLSSRKSSIEAYQSECYESGDSKTWFETKREYDHWRSGAIRFKGHVAMRKKEVKLLQRDVSGDWRGHCRKMLRAIESHKLASESGMFEAEPHDRELWHLLETYDGFIKKYDGVQPSSDNFLL